MMRARTYRVMTRMLDGRIEELRDQLKGHIDNGESGAQSAIEEILAMMEEVQRDFTNSQAAPRCGECGHTMSSYSRGWNCIENTCSIGLAVLGDFASAERHRKREGAMPR